MDKSKICQKCNGKLEKGMSLDRGIGSPTLLRYWAKEKRFFGLTKEDAFVNTYVCVSCGFLERYAINL